MNKHTATLPDGTIATRGSATREYVALTIWRATLASRVARAEDALAYNEKLAAKYDRWIAEGGRQDYFRNGEPAGFYDVAEVTQWRDRTRESIEAVLADLAELTSAIARGETYEDFWNEGSWHMTEAAARRFTPRVFTDAEIRILPVTMTSTAKKASVAPPEASAGSAT